MVISNPTAGSHAAHRLDAVLAILKDAGVQLEMCATTGPGHATETLQNAQLDQFDAVVAAGGDGTLNEVVKGLVGRATPFPPVGVVPLGTANVVARECGIPVRDDTTVARILLTAEPVPIHVAVANDNILVQMAGVGFDARVVAGISLGLKKKFGALAYAWQSLVEFVRNSQRAYTVHANSEAHEVASVIIANGQYYAGSFITSRDARLTEPFLDLCLFKGRRRWDVVRYGWGLLRGSLARFPDVQIIRCKAARVECALPTGRDPIQCDGDLAGVLPLDVRLLPQTVAVLMPS